MLGIQYYHFTVKMQTDLFYLTQIQIKHLYLSFWKKLLGCYSVSTPRLLEFFSLQYLQSVNDTT